MRFLITLFSVLIEVLHGLNAQNKTDNVNWLSFEEVKSKFEQNQKPVLIYFHDEFNDSCKLMINNTFGLDEVSNYINTLFYPIIVDVYSKADFTFFDGTKFQNTGQGKSLHSLVTNLLGEDAKFPSMVLFTKKAEGFVFQAFKDRDHIFPILIFFAESINESTSYGQFEKEYFISYPPGQSQIITRLNLKWKNLDEALELNKKFPKKLFINLYDNYSVSSTMMRLQTYNVPVNANYLNQNFYCVNIDLKTQDTLEFLGKKFINENASHGYHQLPIALLDGKMKLPAFIIFDENLKFLGREQRFFSREEFEMLIRFVGENAFKTQQLEEFKKSFKSNLPKD